MRGVISGKLWAIFTGALLGVSPAAHAQKDPQTLVYLDNVTICPAGATFDPYTGDPDKKCLTSDGPVAGRQLVAVTLSRTDLQTKAAYDVVFTNRTTNEWSRLYFTLTFTDNNNDTADNVTYNAIYPSGSGGFGCTPSDVAQGQKIVCTSNIVLPAGGQQRAVVVVNAPGAGTQLTVAGSAGGYEGKSSVGQGCCAAPIGPVYTALIDSTTDSTFSYTENAITFVKGDERSEIFTGNRSANRADPFTTDVGVPPFAASAGKQYDIGRISETPVPADNGTNCKRGNRFKTCYRTEISLPNVSYLTPETTADVCAAPLLGVKLRIDASLIKGSTTNFDPSQIRVQYRDQLSSNPKDVSPCTATSPTEFPCTCTKEYSNGRILIWMINTKNGFVEFF